MGGTAYQYHDAACAPFTKHEVKEDFHRSQIQDESGLAKMETRRQQKVHDTDSSDSGTGDCSGRSDSSEPELDSDEDMKSFEMVDKCEIVGHIVPKCERNDTSEDADDFTLVNRSSPGLSSSFSALKTGEDRSAIGVPKLRQSNRRKPYDYVKEKAAAVIPAPQPMQTSVKSQLGAATSPSSAAGAEEGKTFPATLQEAAAGVKQEDCKASSTPVDFHDVHKKLSEFVSNVLSVDNLRESFQCCEDAIKLRKVAMIMTESNQLHKFLMVFSHSVSCTNDSCSNTCRMFRRTRGHVSSARHACALMHVYSQMLRMHIDTCVDEDCGLVTCKSMLAMRKLDNLSVLPRHFRQLELLIAQKTAKVTIKKPAVAFTKANVSENKENIDHDAAGVVNMTNKREIPSEAASDRALDLSKTSGGLFGALQTAMPARG